MEVMTFVCKNAPFPAFEQTCWRSIEVVITSTTGNRVAVMSGTRVRIPPSPPRRSKLCIACSDFFIKVGAHSRRCSSSFAKSHAWLTCSAQNALTTVRCRYQLFASYEGSNPTAENAKISFSCGCHKKKSAMQCMVLFLLAGYPPRVRTGSFAPPVADQARLPRRDRRLCRRSESRLLRKKSRSARLLSCKRPRNGSLSLPTFCGCAPCFYYCRFHFFKKATMYCMAAFCCRYAVIRERSTLFFILQEKLRQYSSLLAYYIEIINFLFGSYQKVAILKRFPHIVFPQKRLLSRPAPFHINMQL